MAHLRPRLFSARVPLRRYLVPVTIGLLLVSAPLVVSMAALPDQVDAGQPVAAVIVPRIVVPASAIPPYQPITSGIDPIGVSGHPSATDKPLPDPTNESAARTGDDLNRGSRIPPSPVASPTPAPHHSVRQTASIVVRWHHDAQVSFYGPGFYGNWTACGMRYTTTLMGVAHRSLPCGTQVTFRNPANRREITVPVVDRGPYVDGREWDLTGAACQALDACFTGPMDWSIP